MDEWTIYTEVRNDGSIPLTVLAFHRTEFERRSRDRWYQPQGVEIRNPRLPAPLDDGFDPLRAFIAPTKEQHQLPTENTAPPTSHQQQEMQSLAQQQAEQLGMTPPPPPAALVASAAPNAEWGQHIPCGQQTISTEQPEMNVAQRPSHHLTAELGMNPTSSPTNGAPFSPAQYEQLGWRVPPSTSDSTANSADVPASRPTLAETCSQPFPIPDYIWDIVNQIKALPRNALDMPMRTELSRPALAAHFLKSRGLLKESSLLHPYVGDTRLFDAAWWDHLTRTPGRKEWNAAKTQAGNDRYGP